MEKSNFFLDNLSTSLFLPGFPATSLWSKQNTTSLSFVNFQWGVVLIVRRRDILKCKVLLHCRLFTWTSELKNAFSVPFHCSNWLNWLRGILPFFSTRRARFLREAFAVYNFALFQQSLSDPNRSLVDMLSRVLLIHRLFLFRYRRMCLIINK